MYVLLRNDECVARVEPQLFKIVGEDRFTHLMADYRSVCSQDEHTSAVRIADDASSHVKVFAYPGTIAIEKCVRIENRANNLDRRGDEGNDELVAVFEAHVGERIQARAVRIHLQHNSAA